MSSIYIVSSTAHSECSELGCYFSVSGIARSPREVLLPRTRSLGELHVCGLESIHHAWAYACFALVVALATSHDKHQQGNQT